MRTNLKNFLLKSKSKILFFVMGFGSLIWFLVRVIPKPSRATYPCMRAAAPMASSLVLYLIGLGSFTMLIRKAKDKFKKAKYLVATGLAIAGILVVTISQMAYNVKLNAQPLRKSLVANEPIGEGQGIFPGRVVWAYNPDATNEDCTNDDYDFWYMDENTDLSVVKSMLSQGLKDMTGKSTDKEAWDAIFKYFNKKNGDGENGYKAGEKIVIKINLNGIGNNWTSTADKNINTSPQICYSILEQLVNVVGVNQGDISIGDPNCGMNDATFDYLHPTFPNVTYWGNGSGKTRVQQSTKKVFYASDGSTNDYLPKSYVDAKYMINMAVFKKHHRAGISLCSKNHFGSIAAFTGGAWHLHPSLPCPEATAIAENGDYGSYRCFVDIMGHKDLGGKTILFLVDGLWGSTNWGHPAVKFRMSPFNNDWPSSLFMSQDPVAIETVCFDFLFEEFDETHPTEGEFVGDDKGPYPQFPGTDDFLQQAADPSLWPAGVIYDPENDGTPLKSLGVYEHWNNSTNKCYSRNLGLNKGIELYNKAQVKTDVLELKSNSEGIKETYPNPFTNQLKVNYTLPEASSVTIFICNVKGEKVFQQAVVNNSEGNQVFEWSGEGNNGSIVPAGQYIVNMEVSNSRGVKNFSTKIMKAN